MCRASGLSRTIFLAVLGGAVSVLPHLANVARAQPAADDPLGNARQLALQYEYQEAASLLADQVDLDAPEEEQPGLRLDLGRYLYASGDLTGAKAALELLATSQQPPTDVRTEASVVLAWVRLALGDVPGGAAAMGGVGWHEFAPDSAIGASRLVLALEAAGVALPDLPPGYGDLPGMVRAADNADWQTVDATARALQATPDLSVNGLAVAAAYLAWALESTGRTEEAEQAYQDASRLSDGFAWLETRLGYWELKAGRPNRALDAFERAAVSAAIRGERLRAVHLEAGKISEGAGEIEDAIQHYRWASEGAQPASPIVYDGYRRLGLLYLQTGREEQAETTFLTLLKGVTDPNHVGGAIDGLNRLYGRTGHDKLREAVEEYLETHPDAPGRTEASLWIGYVCDEEGDADGAIRAAQDVLGDESADVHRKARAQLRVAYAYWHSGRLDEAEGAFRVAMEQYAEVSPRHTAIAKGDLGYVAGMGRGDLEEALRLTREALASLPPQSPAAVTFQYRLGWFEERRGNWSAALAEYEQVPEGPASDPHLTLVADLPLGKARCLERLGRLTEAAEQLRRAIHNLPADSSWAKMAQVDLLRLAKAADDIGDAVVLAPCFKKCSPAELRVQLRAGTATTAGLTVTGNPTLEISNVESDTELVRAEVAGGELERASVAHRVRLTIDSATAPGPTQAMLKVYTNDPEHPVIDVPVQIDVLSRFTPRPASLFFGFCRPGEIKEAAVTVVSTVPFSASETGVIPQGMSVQLVHQDERTLTVTVALTAPNAPGTREGTILVATGLADEPVVTLPYYCVAR